MVEEVWRSITVPEFEDLYEVSSKGRVRSLPRQAARAFYQGRILKLGVHPQGYRSVILSGRGKRKTVLVHALVLGAFIGQCPPGNEGRHLNGVRSDNRLENLAWGTSSENEYDKLKTGTMQHGSRNGHAKLSEKDVLDIRQRNANGESQRALAVAYGVSQPQISRLITGTRWGHLSGS